jgi:hypothetical protein
VRPYNQGSDFPTLLALIVAVGFPLLLLSLVFDVFPRDRFERLMSELRLPFVSADARPSPSPIAARAPSPTPVSLAVADWAVSGGHFYTQTNGQSPVTSATGFAVTNDGGLTFWDDFQALGGVEGVGYPLSNRFTWRGFTVQVFQKLVFQGAEGGGPVNIVNVMQDLSSLGKDEWLEKERFTPGPLPADFDAGRAPQDVPAAHLALLSEDSEIEAFYRNSSDAVRRFGLPTSKVTDMGEYLVAIRCQRTVLQRWKKDMPWAKEGQVTIANAGQIAVEAGLFPAEGFRPIASAPPQAGPAPSPAVSPAPAR